MRIKDQIFLITGGAGFIGSHTADTLIEKGARVVVIDNLSTGHKKNLNPKVKFYKLDIADKKVAVIFAKERPDVVYHFAFNVLVPKSVSDPLYDAQSIIGSLNVIKNCQQYKVKKIIFSSSGFLYGNDVPKPTPETQPIDPISPYVVSKYSVENYLRYYQKIFSLPYVVLRYAAVYGPRQVTGAMADYIRCLENNHQATIWGDGEKTRDYVYIDDVINANLLALEVKDTFIDSVFNVGTGIETTLNNLYKQIASLLGKKAKPHYVADRPAEQIRYALDFQKIKKSLGWQPTVSLAEGLRKTIQKTE